MKLLKKSTKVVIPMKISFTQTHNLPETRTTYKKGEELKVSTPIGERLINAKLAVEVTETSKTVKKEQPKQPK